MVQGNTIVPASEGSSGDGFEIGSFDFHGERVIILSNAEGNWAVLGQLSQNLALDPNGQRQMIERKSWSKGRTCVTHVQLPGDVQAHALQEDAPLAGDLNMQTDDDVDPPAPKRMRALYFIARHGPSSTVKKPDPRASMRWMRATAWACVR